MSDIVLDLCPSTSKMSQQDALEFIERTRRQVARIDVLPRPGEETIVPEDAARIRQMCDELEADIRHPQSTA